MAAADRSGYRDALARAALGEIPKLLTLQDRIALSPTYGCFDRAYWHYRISDFPNGMAQEFVLPLALAWSLEMPANPYFRQPEVRSWVEAAIRFAARSAHRDGSCDDYYPFERALGATAFSALACLEACAIIGLDDDASIAAFLKRRARWLARTRESGRLANHEALIVAILARMLVRFGAEWEAPLHVRLARLLSWQSAEGWFFEYGGADPGYLSLTIGLLAETDRRLPDLGLREPCVRAIRFLADLVHPDGTLGGGYTSRGTTSFFPHGLEIAGKWMPEALVLNERALLPLVQGRHPCFSDDHIVGHHVWSWMLAWREWAASRPAVAPDPPASITYSEAGMRIDVHGPFRLYASPARGGAFRLYAGDQLLLSDTGPMLRTRQGRVATCEQSCTVTAEEPDRIVVSGRMSWAKSRKLTPFVMIGLRMFMMTVGRFFPNFVRRLLQWLLVSGRSSAPFHFERTLEWKGTHWHVRDRISPMRHWFDVTAAGLSGFHTSAATVMARVWDPSQFQAWEDWTPRLSALGRDEPLIVTRDLGRDRCDS